MTTMLWFVLFVVILIIGVYSVSPATVMVGNANVVLPKSKIEVLFKNTVGSFSGYGKCPITGLSYYWTPCTPLEYGASGGVTFSSYAVNTLLTMHDKRGAYRVAQSAFERLQMSWGKKEREKLVHPLKVL